MRINTIYVTVILVTLFNLQFVKSRKIGISREEIKANSKKNDPVAKFDISKFVDKLIKDAKKINEKMKNGKPQKKRTEKKKKEQERDESNYDSLGLDEKTKDMIVRSNTADLTLNEMENLFRASNAALDDKKMGHIHRSGGGLSLNDDKEQKGQSFRSVDGPSKEVGSPLVFNIEEYEEESLINPLS